ncbi:MAG: hypothetical protein AVDCRST_MAG53-1840, partial [uncultured Solirubrobacteraceae bacterium]
GGRRHPATVVRGRLRPRPDRRAHARRRRAEALVRVLARARRADRADARRVTRGCIRGPRPTGPVSSGRRSGGTM